MTPTVHTLYAVTEATWPPAERTPAGPWMLRNGAGGGKRVSAATAEGDWHEEDLAAAETAMRMLGQDALFMIREGDEALDAALADRGYEVISMGPPSSGGVAMIQMLNMLSRFDLKPLGFGSSTYIHLLTEVIGWDAVWGGTTHARDNTTHTQY